MPYKSTLFLPKTKFSMRGNLPEKELHILNSWDKLNIAERNKGNKRFILHDGPPYANGPLHMGHALNKILKDIIMRFKRQNGYFVPFIPGWDCHGLPIEWAIKNQKICDMQDIDSFRKQCRQFALSWVDVQRKQCLRLGIVGRFEKPYLTMDFESESLIVKEIFTFLTNGLIYSDVKPVLWSPLEKTVLAEAEIEYKECISPSAYVAFPVVSQSASVLIWTTTPWTIPSNQGIAYHPDISYGIFEMEDGRLLIFAIHLAESIFQAINCRGHLKQAVSLSELKVKHPFFYDRIVMCIAAEFVTDTDGTGLVHIAPDHGEDDFYVGKKFGLTPLDYVDDSGHFRSSVPLLSNACIVSHDGKEGDANQRVLDLLRQNNCLWGICRIQHNYPISMRSKALLIFRATKQWFIRLDGLKSKACQVMPDVDFHPSRSRKRFESMLIRRNDWCISRQRVWGIPIPFFINRNTGHVILDLDIQNRIIEIFKNEGSDSWFSRSPKDFFPSYDPQIHEQVRDIVDVWFESGASYAFVLEHQLNCLLADLYLEGSDQHRGWFQSSLLEALGTRNRSPYRTLLTHGFVVDQKGRKMSKSSGNVVTPDDIINKYGSDILRLWAASSTYEDDIRIGDDLLQRNVDVYRRIRNTLRWLLGNIAKECLVEIQNTSLEDITLPKLEQWIAHRLIVTDRLIQEAYEKYDFLTVVRLIHDFCAFDCSSFYFDIRKDCLYCDPRTSQKRFASIWILYHILNSLLSWCAPILCFTTEEAFRCLWNDDVTQSIHLKNWFFLPQKFFNESINMQFQKLIPIRDQVLVILEQMRQDKIIGSALETCVHVNVSQEIYDFIVDIFEADLFIVSSAVLSVGSSPIKVSIMNGIKCQRCWKITNKSPICSRCEPLVS